jgi:hypothetical protein
MLAVAVFPESLTAKNTETASPYIRTMMTRLYNSDEQNRGKGVG